MAKLIIKNLSFKELDVAKHQTILNALAEHQIDWMQACGGKGRCTTCKMIISEGEENISQPTEFEKKFQEQNRLQAHERLTCQTKICKGIVVGIVPKQYQLPHMKYDN